MNLVTRRSYVQSTNHSQFVSKTEMKVHVFEQIRVRSLINYSSLPKRNSFIDSSSLPPYRGTINFSSLEMNLVPNFSFTL